MMNQQLLSKKEQRKKFASRYAYLTSLCELTVGEQDELDFILEEACEDLVLELAMVQIDTVVDNLDSKDKLPCLVSEWTSLRQAIYNFKSIIGCDDILVISSEETSFNSIIKLNDSDDKLHSLSDYECLEDRTRDDSPYEDNSNEFIEEVMDESFANSIKENISDLPFLFPVWFGFLDQNDGNNPMRNKRFFNNFYFQGATPRSQVTLDLTSETNTFLQLVDAETDAVIAFDDDSSFGLDSRLSFTVQSDVNYIFQATTFSPRVTGSYTLSTTSVDLTPASAIFANDSVEATLGFTDFINSNHEGITYDGYLLTGFEVRASVSIDIDGELDTFLQLVDAETGTVLVKYADSGIGLNSSLSFTVQAQQDYILHVTSFGFGETGDYTLTTTTSSLEPMPEAVIEFALFQQVRGLDPDELNSPTDGFGNNVDDPERGTAGSAFINIAPLDYGDGISTPTGEDRPNAREISNAISQQDGDVRDPRGLTNLIWGWGQFLDHDITLNLDDEHGAEIEIEIPENDPALDPSNVISLRESEFVEGTGTSPSNPRQLPNDITAFVDGSNVYGSDDEQLDNLRTFTGGQLRVSEGNLLPISFEGRPQFEAGDVRANENSVLTSLHTLFVREHNRLADELAEAHPTWTDDQLFERARQLNIAQIQNVTFNEYLPTLLGESLPDYEGYDSDVDPAISRVFANAAFRLGHTQLSSIIPQLNPDGSASGGDLRLSDVFFPGVELLQEEGIDGILRGVASSNSQRVDNLVIEDVRSLLFGEGPNSPARDLAAINIERGRLNGVADYNTVRESFGLSRVNSFDEISSDPQIQQTLADLYGTVDNIDAFVGLLAEDLEPGSSVGETVGTILVDQFSRLRDGDRFYFENSLLPEEAEVVRQTTLSDIIRRNTDTTIIQDNAFTLTNIGSNEDDTLNGGLGDDLIVGRGGDDHLSGYAGEDNLIGRSGDDHLSGGTEGDRLIGRSGNDYLIGDSGSDTLVGGSGRDRFVLGDAELAYYIEDFATIIDFDQRRNTLQLYGTVRHYELELVSSDVGNLAALADSLRFDPSCASPINSLAPIDTASGTSKYTATEAYVDIPSLLVVRLQGIRDTKRITTDNFSICGSAFWRIEIKQISNCYEHGSRNSDNSRLFESGSCKSIFVKSALRQSGNNKSVMVYTYAEALPLFVSREQVEDLRELKELRWELSGFQLWCAIAQEMKRVRKENPLERVESNKFIQVKRLCSSEMRKFYPNGKTEIQLVNSRSTPNLDGDCTATYSINPLYTSGSYASGAVSMCLDIDTRELTMLHRNEKLNEHGPLEETAVDNQRAKYLDWGLRYYGLSTQDTMSEPDADELQELLELAQEDIALCFLIEKIDSIIFDEDVLRDFNEIKRFKDQKSIIEEMIVYGDTADLLECSLQSKE